MDYYNLTVFEFTTNRLGSQGTVCAGGRYDYLVEQLGGKPAPAVGWALGVDRILELLKEQGFPMVELELDAYAIISDISALPVVLKTIEALRSAGISVQMHPSNDETMGSLKSQFKKADGSKARHALIFGTDEIAQNQVTVKALRDGTGSQVSQSLLNVLEWASTLQSTK
jgi:histidyl-tRNA synthetase